jgi:hypothetical protein
MEQGNASSHVAQRFHYLNNSSTGKTWSIAARNPGNDPDLILERATVATKFAILRGPTDIHFGQRELFTTNLFGPYNDVPRASDVEGDYREDVEKWRYGFEIVNTEHDDWTMTLQATPFTNKDGIVGANPVAVSKDVNNPGMKDIVKTPLRVITRRNEKGESIKFHWTELDYRIEAQTALKTVIESEYISTFTWTLLVAPD